MGTRDRGMIISSALMALFLGALDALVMSAAMPTIIAELGGLSLYAWVYSAYFLARAVSLPVFGKLSDLFPAKQLMLVSMFLFVAASAAAGASPSMGFLVGARVFQGIGAGGIFALVYLVLSDVTLPGQRGKTLSLASSVWGLSSVIGPTLGGFIVSYFSWRWIFFINLPLGLVSFLGIFIFFKEFREKPCHPSLDWAGITCFSGAVLGGLTLVMTGGQQIPWTSATGLALAGATLVLALGFVLAEQRARDPFLDFRFFKYPGFALGNIMAFGASFSMFSLFAYAPLFLQVALGQTPMVVGYAMLCLSLGWSAGSLVLGRVVHERSAKNAAIVGSLLMVDGTCPGIWFTMDTRLGYCFALFTVTGLGMGCIILSTLLIVQDSVGKKDLGLVTSFHQFAKTLGGNVGVGVCGGLVNSRLFAALDAEAGGVAPHMVEKLQKSMPHLFQPEFQAQMPGVFLDLLQSALLEGVGAVFAVVAGVSILGIGLGFFLPGK
ncbi:MAG: MFS transporter [Desulfobacter sp.]|nr:MFS transporter [Desulfobacter sp.]